MKQHQDKDKSSSRREMAAQPDSSTPKRVLNSIANTGKTLMGL